uniref:Eukaryotic translation initiation factor 4 gamma 1 n=1 Tax=Cacopsylla melanoneura TaxID=428564 RepID=A0A8D8X3C6_9HEMI
MSEPIAVEENLDEGSMPEPRNFICGVVEGELVESPNAAALPSEDKIDDEPSTVSLLHLSNNPWRRGCGEKWNKAADWTEQVPPYDAIEALHLLNKLTESNFEMVASKFCNIQNEHSNNMERIADMFFTKAISEPLYTKLYCRLLKKLFDSKETNKNALNLVLLIITQCNLLLFSSANKEFDLEENKFDKLKLEGTFSLYYELFNLNLVTLSSFLMVLFGFLQSSRFDNLPFVVQVIQKCGGKVERDVQHGENKGETLVWTKILDLIGNKCNLQKDDLSRRTSLMLSNILLLKERSWESALTDSVTNDDPVCEIQEQAPQKRPSKQERRREKREKRRLARQQKPDLGTVMVTEWWWKRDLDEVTTETKWKTKTKQFQPRHVRIQEPVRNEKKEEIAHKAKENERKEEFMVQDILKDLDMADNPWRRGEFKQELTVKDRIIMEAKTLLNKLAENNFQSIVDQFCKINFLPGTIEPIVNTLFVKGILETKFTELHAKFVKSVSDSMDNMATGGTKVDDVGETETERVRTKHVKEVDEAVQFDLKTRMLHKCAMEIHRLHSESSVISDEIYHQKRLNLDMARPNFDELINNREQDDVFLMHHREALKKIISVGTCQFLGELYNADVVDTDFILTTIVCDLLAYDSEEILECAVKLISVVGKKLERVIKKSLNVDYRDGWDIVLEDIATKASRRDRWSNRVYFMLLDLMDLKERDWLPRVIIIPTRQFKAPKKSRGY